MPTPWGKSPPSFSVQEIPHAQDRALTLRQLRDLSHLVKGLCKVGLLRHPRTAQRIKWTQITQHEITSQIIKKVIPKEHSCSWVELVANGQPQRRRFFCSHNWSEPFCDFVLTIEHHARVHGISTSCGYWICVYADNQWHLDLGMTLEQSPFFEALRGAEMTILLLDKTSEALRRLWCNFELHETIQLGQKLEVWTRLGKVGKGLVASGPVVESLELFDTAQARASNPCDRRQIMNHIAGVPELDGIMVLEGNKKVLDPHAGDNYEECLYKRTSHMFEELNDKLKAQTLKSVQSKSRKQPNNSCADLALASGLPKRQLSEVEDAVFQCVTLEQLRRLMQQWRSLLAKYPLVDPDVSSVHGSNRFTWDNFTWKHAMETFIKRHTTKSKSYAAYLSEERRRPDYRVVLWWGQPLKNFMMAIEWHAEARQLPDSTSYWIKILSESPHKEDKKAGERIEEQCIEDYADGLLIVLWQDSSSLMPLRGAFATHLAMKHGKNVDIASLLGCLATTRPFGDGSWEVGAFLEKNILHFECRSALEADEEMKAHLLEKITSSYGSCERFDQLLREKCVGPLLREASSDGDLRRIRAVTSMCPGLQLQSAHLRGSLGETALHAAASAGYAEAVMLLLSLQADADAQDNEGETPLHFAAMAGQAKIVKLLLDAGADPVRVSYSQETPLEVAEQNPGFFCASSESYLSTDEVVRLLHGRKFPCRSVLTNLRLKRMRWGGPLFYASFGVCFSFTSLMCRAAIAGVLDDYLIECAFACFVAVAIGSLVFDSPEIYFRFSHRDSKSQEETLQASESPPSSDLLPTHEGSNSSIANSPSGGPNSVSSVEFCESAKVSLLRRARTLSKPGLRQPVVTRSTVRARTMGELAKPISVDDDDEDDEDEVGHSLGASSVAPFRERQTYHPRSYTHW